VSECEHCSLLEQLPPGPCHHLPFAQKPQETGIWGEDFAFPVLW